MTRAEALAVLSAALGVVERKPIPKELAARALAEALSAHAASGGVPSSMADVLGTRMRPPRGSAIAELAEHVAPHQTYDDDGEPETETEED